MDKQVKIGVNTLVGKALANKVGVSFTLGGQEISRLRNDDEQVMTRDVEAEVDSKFATATLTPKTLVGELFVALLAAGA